jgi:secondary thiamine-phosphate synthase enzyme
MTSQQSFEQREILVSTSGKGLYLITDQVFECFERSLPKTGLLNLFIQHTSASLLIQENADPSAREDLEEFLERLIPEGEPWYRHTHEGPDDTTSHLKSALTATALTLPIQNGRVALGTWQGIYLWEHRHAQHHRKILATAFGER